MKRLAGCCGAVFALMLVLAGCSTSTDEARSTSSAASVASSGDPTKPDARTPGWDVWGHPINGGPKGEDGSTGNNLGRNFCAHNKDQRCPVGSYVGPFTGYHDKHGYWDAQGKPVNGGPVGADGSTGNNLTQAHCARNEDPGCPKGSFVAINAMRDPRGGPHYVKCEGTICTNPNHGAGIDPRHNGGDDTATGVWDAKGKPIAGGPKGADGSINNNLTQQHCATHQDPGCPAGSYVQPQQRPAADPPEPGQTDMQGPNRNDDGDQNKQQDPPEPGQGEMKGPQGDKGGDDSDDDKGGDDKGGDQQNDQQDDQDDGN